MDFNNFSMGISGIDQKFNLVVILKNLEIRV